MTAIKKSLGIYGVQDIDKRPYPVFVHDHSLAVYQDGILTNYLHLERISRKKYDNCLPETLYDNLKGKKLLYPMPDVAFVDNTLGRAFVTRNGKLRFECNRSTNLALGLEKGSLFWLDDHHNGFCLNHELAHLYACIPFFGPFQENSVLFHFDGGASKGNYSVWHYRNQKLGLLEYGWDLKMLSRLFNANALVFKLLGATMMEQNNVPGKFMGYAAYGKPDENILKWLKAHSFFEDIWSSPKPFFDSVRKEFGINLPDFDLTNSFLQQVAATIHHYFVEQTVQFIKGVKERTGASYLYYSGGSALNIVCNTAIQQSGLFQDVFIPPCSNDAGLSIGAAVALELSKGNVVLPSQPYINNWDIEHYRVNYNLEDIKVLANMIMQGQCVGVCNGYAEAGPRALGNRSILARADDKGLAKKLNEQLKRREWYRPLAPVMLVKNIRKISDDAPCHRLSCYMLYNYHINDSGLKMLAGAVHIDGTARVQTLENRHENPFLFDLLEFLDERYDLKALINTSFNIKGEPMVHTVDDAVKAGHSMGLDAVVLNGEVKPLVKR